MMEMESIHMPMHLREASATIPFRYRTLLYVRILLLAIDLGINVSEEFLAVNIYEQLIIFIVQDVCIVLAITLLLMMILTTFVAQAGLLCLLLRLFRAPIITACIYLTLCVATQTLMLLPRFRREKFDRSTFADIKVLVLYVIQRTCSAFYYYAMKRATYRLSDPHFYQSSKWLQEIWEKRRMALTGAIATSPSEMVINRCMCCVIQ